MQPELHTPNPDLAACPSLSSLSENAVSILWFNLMKIHPIEKCAVSIGWMLRCCLIEIPEGAIQGSVPRIPDPCWWPYYKTLGTLDSCLNYSLKQRPLLTTLVDLHAANEAVLMVAGGLSHFVALPSSKELLPCRPNLCSLGLKVHGPRTWQMKADVSLFDAQGRQSFPCLQNFPNAWIEVFNSSYELWTLSISLLQNKQLGVGGIFSRFVSSAAT